MYPAQVFFKKGETYKNGVVKNFYWTTGGDTHGLKGKTEFGAEYVIHISKIREIVVK